MTNKTYRKRFSNVPIEGRDHPIERPEPRDRQIFQLLHPTFGHRFLPSLWIRYHFPRAMKSNSFINRLSFLGEQGNEYIERAPFPLNMKTALNRHIVWQLSPKGAEYVGEPIPKFSTEQAWHEFLVSIHECSLKFQARERNIPFFFLEHETYKLNSGRHWNPDGHPILLGDTLIHTEVERNKWHDKKDKTIEKVDKAIEYIESGMYRHEAKSALTLFLSTTTGRTNALKEYAEAKRPKCPFLLFATTKEWDQEASLPHPEIPLVPQWERVGYPEATDLWSLL